MKIKSMQRPGIEPGPPAWQARILPLNQRCLLAEMTIALYKTVHHFIKSFLTFTRTDMYRLYLIVESEDSQSF